jgi:hypothetical protein
VDQIICLEGLYLEQFPKLISVHVLNFRQTEQFLFSAVLDNLSGLNKFCHCGQRFIGLQYLSFDSKITLIVSVVLEI